MIKDARSRIPAETEECGFENGQDTGTRFDGYSDDMLFNDGRGRAVGHDRRRRLLIRPASDGSAVIHIGVQNGHARLRNGHRIPHVVSGRGGWDRRWILLLRG